jgi:hypothetical protein
MVRLALAVFLLFGLVWLAASLGPSVIATMQPALPAGAMVAINTGAGLVASLAGHGMGLSAAAMLAFAVARRGVRGMAIWGMAVWGWICLMAIPVLAAFAALQFDPRLSAAAQEAVGPLFNRLRASLPQIRISLFLGVCLIASAGSLSQAGGRVVTALVLISWAALAVLADPSATPVLALPALATLAIAALRLREGDTPGAAYILIGTLFLLAGLGLGFANSSPWADLKPEYLLFPLIAAAAIGLQPRLPSALFWVHALFLAFCLAYLSQSLNQFGDLRPALTLAEIRASVARASTLRTGMGGVAVLSVLLMLGAIWHRRTR